MTKSDIWQFDPVDANNTDIEGIDVNTGWAPNQVGPSFRALMGRLARVCQGLAPWLGAVIDGAAATTRPLWFTTAFSSVGSAGYRWLVCASATAETGSNAGSDFLIAPCSDSGALGASALSINRATSAVNITGALNAASTASVAGALTVGSMASNGSVSAVGSYTSSSNGGHYLQFSSANCLELNQSGTNAATGLVVNLAKVTSLFAYWQFAGSTVGAISTNGTSTTYGTTSDYRLKVTAGLCHDESVLNIPVYTGSFKATPATVLPMMLAHEIQAVAPEAVVGEKDGHEMQMVDYSKLIPRMLAAMQGLQTRIKALEKA